MSFRHLSPSFASPPLQLPAAKTGLQSGDVVFVHRKEAGQGAKAAAEVVDTFNHRAQQQKEEEVPVAFSAGIGQLPSMWCSTST